MAGEPNLSLSEFRGIPPETRYRNAVDSYLRSHIGTYEPETSQMALHHLGYSTVDGRTNIHSAGKQLRPTALCLTVDAMGGAWDGAVPAAAAIELFHNATLGHDDIEDGDSERHGQPTLNEVWGVPRAINVGDIMLSESARLLLHLPKDKFDAQMILDAMGMFTKQTRNVFDGQDLDIKFEELPSISRAQYYDMISKKTGALFALSYGMGALLAGRDKKVISAMKEFGENLGKGFQIADDLGELVNPGEIPSDILKRKKTLPVVLAQEQVGISGHDRFMQLIAPQAEPPSGVESREILDFLKSAGTIDEVGQLLKNIENGLLADVKDLPIEDWARDDFTKIVTLTLKI